MFCAAEFVLASTASELERPRAMHRRVYDSCKRLASSRPISNAFLTGFGVMSLGDAAAQKQTGAEHIDLKRNLSSSAYNGLASPLFYKWYRLMDWGFGTSATARKLIPKVLCSQLVTTGCNNPCYLLWTNHVEAWCYAPEDSQVDWPSVRRKAIEQFWRELPTLYGSSMCFWLPSTACTYALVPDHLRIMWISSCSVLWGGFVSYVAHRESPTGDGITCSNG